MPKENDNNIKVYDDLIDKLGGAAKAEEFLEAHSEFRITPGGFRTAIRVWKNRESHGTLSAIQSADASACCKNTVYADRIVPKNNMAYYELCLPCRITGIFLY
jgi:hypothetical protein